MISFQQNSKGAFCYIVEQPQDFATSCTLSGYYRLQQHAELFFDAHGAKYQKELLLKRRFGKWQKLLSYVYWGKVPFESIWHQLGSYSLPELKSQIDVCIQADDDVLTQFIEADHLQKLVSQARHFEDVYMVLCGAIYNFEDDDSLEE
ncbi:hypothetical protein [Hymenobacter elongatus]|uniref:Uncharacterized protein n=1 Tax=Hymenobacter elongatus TaxID=877208 RepID=A0A4Z0PQS2_9BACT|nr:hypothetical protein [Hymenobacter elongatus]TGE19664.1 hypothetical protein E5J99_02580 [Hymenobacter elongatus]